MITTARAFIWAWSNRQYALQHGQCSARLVSRPRGTGRGRTMQHATYGSALVAGLLRLVQNHVQDSITGD